MVTNAVRPRWAEFGSMLAAWRRMAGLTQAEFAILIGKSKGYTYQLESGRIRPPLNRERVDLIAQALGVNGAAVWEASVEFGTPEDVRDYWRDGKPGEVTDNELLGLVLSASDIAREQQVDAYTRKGRANAADWLESYARVIHRLRGAGEGK